MTTLLFIALVAAAAQQPPPRPAFEAASIKHNRSVSDETSLRRPVGGRFSAQNVTLEDLLQYAYQKQRFEIVDAPGWVGRDRFDVTATMGAPVPPATDWTADETRLAVQTLLERRFGLVAREEEQARPIFALIRARPEVTLPSALRSSSADCRTPCGFRQNGGRMELVGRPLSLFASFLSSQVGRIVLDQTGLSGNWDFELSLPADGTPIVTVIQEQLGLKLEPRTAAVRVLVIDRVSPPTED